MAREPKIDQDDIDHAVRVRLSAVVPILELLQSQEGVELGSEPFTDDGLATLRTAQLFTMDAAMYLGDEVLCNSTDYHDTRLLFDVQRFFAIAALALKSMGADGHEWVEGPHSVRYLLELAQGLQERAEAEENGRDAPTVSEPRAQGSEDAFAAGAAAAKALALGGGTPTRFGGVRRLAEGGRGIAELGAALQAIKTGNPDLLALLKDRLIDVCELMWEIEAERLQHQRPPAWEQLCGPLGQLPVLLIATRAALAEPDREPFPRGGSQWSWCAEEAERLGALLVAWAERQQAADAEVARA